MLNRLKHRRLRTIGAGCEMFTARQPPVLNQAPAEQEGLCIRDP